MVPGGSQAGSYPGKKKQAWILALVILKMCKLCLLSLCPQFPCTSGPPQSPESVLSTISRDGLLSTPRAAPPRRDEFGTSHVPGTVLRAGDWGTGACPPFSTPLWCTILQSTHTQERLQAETESERTHHPAGANITLPNLFSASPNTPSAFRVF